MEPLGTTGHRREHTGLEGRPGTHSVVRPKPTLPSGDAAPMASHASAFQRLAVESAEAVPESPQAAAPRGYAGGATAPTAYAEQLQTTSEDELAATTVGSLQHNRGAGPSQLDRERSRDSDDGLDELSRPTPAPALHASQQAMLQQQVRRRRSAVVMACGVPMHRISPWGDQIAFKTPPACNGLVRSRRILCGSASILPAVLHPPPPSLPTVHSNHS